MKRRNIIINPKTTLITAVVIFIIGASGYYFVRGESKTQNSAEIDRCLSIKNDQERMGCLEAGFRNIDSGEELDASFAVIKNLYEKDQVFAKSCHAFMHIIGESGYGMYSEGYNLKYNNGMLECAYGFFHGFIEKLIAETGGQYKKAGEFCVEFANSQDEISSTNLTYDCFHGIGHGVIDDELGYGNREALVQVVEETLKLCDNISDRKDYLGFCADGVFHSVGDIFADNFSSDLYDPEDPFEICKLQEGEFRAVCYGAFSHFVMELHDNNFREVIKYLENIEEERTKEVFVGVLAMYRAYLDVTDPNFRELIDDCRLVPPSLFDICLNNLANGLMDYGKPNEQVFTAMDLCRFSILSQSERHECASHVIGRTLSNLGRASHKNLCKNLEDEFYQYCEI